MNIVTDIIDLYDRMPQAALPAIVIPGSEYDGRSFVNPVFRIKADSPDALSIHLTAERTDFAVLQEIRAAAVKNQPSLQEVLNELSSPEGRKVSNIGVSAAITVSIDGERFAVLQYRPHSNVHGLISGYVDARSAEETVLSGRELVTFHTLEELRQEFIAANRPGDVLRGSVSGDPLRDVLGELVIGRGDALQRGTGEVVNLGAAYSKLSYEDGARRWHLRQTELPSYVFNLHGVTTQEIDHAPLANVGFQYSQRWNAGQLLYSFELSLPADREGLFLFHAEDGPIAGAEPWRLETQLSPDNLVLFKLDSSGFLSENTYYFRDGALVRRDEFDRSNIVLSAAFAGPLENNARYAGFTDRGAMPFNEYREMLKSYHS